MQSLKLKNKDDLTILESSMVNGFVDILRSENGDKFVYARELHQYLGATERFSSWISRQFKNGFEENLDYTSVKDFTVVNNGAKKEIDNYILTMDCAKQLSMMAKNNKGRSIRKYFIECEKQLHVDNTKDKLLLSLFSNNPLEVATAHKSLLEIETKPLIATIEKQKPDVEFSQRVQDSCNTNYTMQQASKILKLPFGRNKLLEVLRHEDVKFLDMNNIAYQNYIDRNYFRVVLTEVNGYIKKSTQMTGKGINWIDTKHRTRLINTYEKIKSCSQ